MPKSRLVLGVDVGGTFTDVVAVDEEGNKWTAKSPSSPADPSIGVANAIEKIAAVIGSPVEEIIPQTDRFVYGTTVATNALLQRKGSDMAVITTRGFRDTLLLRRMRREGGFDIWSHAHVPIVPRRRIYEVSERLDHKGDIVTPLDEDGVREVASELRRIGIESVAVCLLFSPLNPIHEQRVAEILLREIPQLQISLSSVVCPEIREYERTSTTAINAFLVGSVKGHLEQLQSEFRDRGLATAVQVMQSSGGVTTAEFAAERPINIFLSGPAGGAVATSYLGQVMDGAERGNLLSCDMGGTSFDICLMPGGSIPISMTNTIHGWSLLAPSTDIRAIGAGGGSIAWVDVGGGLHVGPQSAGAVPGPASYLRGGVEPTVTDADLVLGYLNPDYFLAGEMELSLERAQQAVQTVADKIDMPLMETASGIFRIVNNNMLEVIRLATVGKGHDPRDYTLVVFGGAGAIHVPAFASELGIDHMIIPRDASEYCALGVVVSDVRFDFARNMNASTGELAASDLIEAYAELKRQGDDRLDALHIEPANRYFTASADMKFPGEYGEMLVAMPDDITSMAEIAERFIEVHRQQYAYVEDAEPDIVNIRLAAFGKAIKPNFTRAVVGDANCDAAIRERRDADFHEEGGTVLTPVYAGDQLMPGNRLAGPAIVELPTTTVVVRPQQTLHVDALFNFRIACKNGEDR